LYLRLCDGFDWKRQIKRLNINILGSLFKIKQKQKLDFNIKSINIFPKGIERDLVWQYLINLLIVWSIGLESKEEGSHDIFSLVSILFWNPLESNFLPLTVGRTGSRGLIVFRLRSDHAFSKLCAQTAPVTRFCGFLVQLVLSKKEKIRLT